MFKHILLHHSVEYPVQNRFCAHLVSRTGSGPLLRGHKANEGWNGGLVLMILQYSTISYMCMSCRNEGIERLYIGCQRVVERCTVSFSSEALLIHSISSCSHKN